MATRASNAAMNPFFVFSCTALKPTIWCLGCVCGYRPRACVQVCDTNLAGALLPNGTMVGIWRHCETINLHTEPHSLLATDPVSARSTDHSYHTVGVSQPERPCVCLADRRTNVPALRCDRHGKWITAG